MGHVLEGGQQTALNAGNDTAVDRWPPFLPQGLVHDWLQKGVYAGRRQRLLAQLAPDSVALLPTLPEQVRSRDTHHRYRADSSVVYSRLACFAGHAIRIGKSGMAAAPAWRARWPAIRPIRPGRWTRWTSRC